MIGVAAEVAAEGGVGVEVEEASRTIEVGGRVTVVGVREEVDQE